MDNGKNINSEKINALINEAARKSGISQDTIRGAAQSGNIDKLLSNLDSDGAKKLQKILSDKRATKEFLSTPEARSLLAKILGEKK